MNRGFPSICYLPVLLLCLGCLAKAEDLKLNNGKVLREIRVVEVRPDALIIAHRDGVMMADFEQLPKPVRSRYGFDARKAAAHREREATARRAVAEENRRLIEAHEQRKMALALAQSDASEGSSAPGRGASQLTYAPGASERAYEAAVARVGQQIGQAEEARLIEKREATTFWGAPIWKSPVVKFIGLFFGGGGAGSGSNSEPRNWH